MNLPFHIARRYFFSGKNKTAINIITLISVIGVTIGTFALIFVLSIFNGFESLIVRLFRTFNSDIKITASMGNGFAYSDSLRKIILANPNVAFCSPTVEGKALLKYRDHQTVAFLKGVDSGYKNISSVDTSIIGGEFNTEDDFLVLGSGVAYQLNAPIEDEFNPIVIYAPERINPAGIFSGNAGYRRETGIASGVFSVQKEFDETYAFADIELAKKVFGMRDKVSALEIRLKDLSRADETRNELQKILSGGYKVLTWYEQNAFLYKVMRTEKWAAYFILALILFIAAVNIIGSLAMMIIEKRKDLTILRAVGATKPLVKKIFLMQGFLIGCIGAGAGAMLAFIGGFLQMRYGWLKLQGSADAGFIINAYPLEMHGLDFLLAGLTVFIICILAGWYPALKASRIDIKQVAVH